MRLLILLITLASVASMSLAFSVNVYKSTAPINNTNHVLSGLRIKNGPTNISVSHLPGLSICVRFNFKILMDMRSILYQIESSITEDPSWKLAYFIGGDKITFLGFGKDYLGNIPNWIVEKKTDDGINYLTANRWHHVCMSFDVLGSYIKVVLDGKETDVDFVDLNIKMAGIPSDFLTTLTMGRCLDESLDCSRHGGQFTDFNIWSIPLEKDEMLEWTTCQSEAKGDLINWNETEWDVTRMSQHQMDIAKLCQHDNVGTIVVPGDWDMEGAGKICQQLGGHQAVVGSSYDQQKYLDIFMSSQQCAAKTPKFYWTGWWDYPSEGTFTNVNNGSLLSENNFAPWGLGEPNGKYYENCAVVTENGMWKDFSCKLKTCAICTIKDPPVFTMKGLCPESNFDIHYSWSSEISAKSGDAELFTFLGYSKSQILWDRATKLWKLESYQGGRTVAYLNNSRSAYPFGTNTWTFFNDTCSDSPQTIKTITFSSCNESEFSCTDGTCIPLEERCNGVVNCDDKSDELGCERLVFDPAYIKILAPPPPPGKEKPDLVVDIRLTKIFNIDEVGSKISYKFGMWISWRDSRLTYKNLKDSDNYNSLSAEEKTKIWVPSFIFSNTAVRFHAVYNTPRSIGRVSKWHNGTRSEGRKSEDSDPINTKLFPGAECPIKIVNFFAKDFTCDLNMAMYPFDIQTCRATFILKGLDRNLINLINGSLSYRGSYNIQQYVLLDVSFLRDIPWADVMINPPSSVSIQIVLGRRLLSVILTSFVLTIILVMVSLSTNFVHPKWFEGIVTVNLTSMLVLVTLFVSDTKSLPKTAYMKMIDIWAIITMAIPFTEVALHTILDLLRKQKEEATNQKGELFVALKWAEEVMDFKSQADKVKEIQLERVIAKRSTYIAMTEFFSKYILPMIFFTFAICFFISGSVIMVTQ